jgi:hypothetical protein
MMLRSLSDAKHRPCAASCPASPTAVSYATQLSSGLAKLLERDRLLPPETPTHLGEQPQVAEAFPNRFLECARHSLDKYQRNLGCGMPSPALSCVLGRSVYPVIGWRMSPEAVVPVTPADPLDYHDHDLTEYIRESAEAVRATIFFRQPLVRRR